MTIPAPDSTPEMGEGQRPQPSEPQRDPEPETSSSGETEEIRDPVAHKAAQEAAALRVKLRKAEKELARRKKAEEERERVAAEEAGEFKALYQARNEQIEAAKATILREKVTSALVGAGIPSAFLQHLKLPTDGLSVTDDFRIEGDLDTAVQELVEVYRSVAPASNGSSNGAEAHAQPQTVISERARTPAPVKPKVSNRTELADSIANALTKSGYGRDTPLE